MEQFVTPNGKPVSTFVIPNTGHIGIKFNQGGELPSELSGAFTTTRLAEIAIKNYIAKQEVKKDK